MPETWRLRRPEEGSILEPLGVVGDVDPRLLLLVDQDGRGVAVEGDQLQALLLAVHPLSHQPLPSIASWPPGDADEVAVLVGQRQFVGVAGLDIDDPERDMGVLVAGEGIAMRFHVYVVAALVDDWVWRDVAFVDSQPGDPPVLRPPVTSELAELLLRDVIGEAMREAVFRAGGQLRRL